MTRSASTTSCSLSDSAIPSHSAPSSAVLSPLWAPMKKQPAPVGPLPA